MKYLIFLIIFFVSCTHHDDDDDYYYNTNNYQPTKVMISSYTTGNLNFYVYRYEYYKSIKYGVNVVNNATYEVYSFDYQLQLWNNGVLIDTSQILYVNDLKPMQAQNNDCVLTSFMPYTNVVIAVNDLVVYSKAYQ